MESLWKQTANMPHFPTLQGDRKTDVLVIGGGMAGLLCLWRLRRAGVDCMLAEADTLCGGVTANTTAKLTAQHGLVYHKLLCQLGQDAALAYYRANREALNAYRALCTDMDCDFEERSAFVYTRSHPERMEKELAALRLLQIPAVFHDTLPLPFPVAGAIEFPGQAQFHPLRFASSLSRGLPIWEHTPVRELKGTDAVTDHGTIHAEKIVVATHFPFLNKHGFFFLKLYQHRSYVLALKGCPELNGMYVADDRTGLSFRNYQDYLLLGGGGHRTGKRSTGWEGLQRLAFSFYPEASVEGCWAAQDCMSLDGLPYIGRYSARMGELYVASGFQKWGMTGSMAAAKVLCDLILGKQSEYASLFSPSRSMLHPQLAVNAFEALTHLILPARKRCPHMGCGLKWNPQERSWDCPCHGSRFSESGKLLDNPATGDLPDRKNKT